MEKLQKAIEEARKERQSRVNAGEAPVEEPAAPAPTADISDWSTLPTVQPNTMGLMRRRVVSFKPSPVTTPFDVLRTKCLQQMSQNGWKRLLITSPTPECGKTTLAANLAYGIARQQQKRAIFFDLDLRKPQLSKVIGHTPQNEMADLLSGRVSFHEHAVKLSENVAMCLTKSRAPDPTSLLTGARLQEVIDKIEAEQKADVMAFDMPPLLANDDARSLLTLVDCVLLVARAERTTAKQIDICEREIAQHSNVLGVVLNQCRFAEETSGYDYYEGY